MSFRCLLLVDSCARSLPAFSGSRCTTSTLRMPELTHSISRESVEQIGSVLRYGRRFRQNRNTPAIQHFSFCPTLDATPTTTPAETAFSTIEPEMRCREQHG